MYSSRLVLDSTIGYVCQQNKDIVWNSLSDRRAEIAVVESPTAGHSRYVDPTRGGQQTQEVGSIVPRHLRITAGAVVATAALNECPTANLIWNQLPISVAGSTWGDEIYFSIPVRCAEEASVAVVEKGDLAFWPPGHAFCIFWGPTPASLDDEIRLASPINVVGKIEGDATVFGKVRSGTVIVLERLPDQA